MTNSESDPQKAPSEQQEHYRETTSPSSDEIIRQRGTNESQNKAQPSSNLLRSLHPSTAQEWWNILLVIFTGILSFVAWQQYWADSAYLTLADIAFETAPGFVTVKIENAGRRRSSEVNVTLYHAYYDPAGKVVGNTVYKNDFVAPEIPAGKAPYMISFEFPQWSTAHLDKMKQGLETIRVGLELSYDWSIAGRSYGRFCQQIVSIKNNTEITWGPCSLSELDQMETTAATYLAAQRKFEHEAAILTGTVGPYTSPPK